MAVKHRQSPSPTAGALAYGEKVQEPKYFSSVSINFMSVLGSFLYINFLNFMSVLGSFLYIGFLIDQVLDSTSERRKIVILFSWACQALESTAIEIFMKNRWWFSNRLCF
jgi:hypothetical protein